MDKSNFSDAAVAKCWELRKMGAQDSGRPDSQIS